MTLNCSFFFLHPEYDVKLLAFLQLEYKQKDNNMVCLMIIMLAINIVAWRILDTIGVSSFKEHNKKDFVEAILFLNSVGSLMLLVLDLVGKATF